MSLPAIPEKHEALVEAEHQFHSIRAQRREVEAELRRVETQLSRLRLRDEAELDEIAERLAEGAIDRVADVDLQQRDVLRGRLELLSRADQKAAQRLTRERERHNNRIVAAFRPSHRAATQRIAAAVRELVAANEAEAEIRHQCPVALVAMGFPNVGGLTVNNAGPAKYWMEYAERLGFFDADEPEPVKPRKGTAGRLVPRRVKANGAAEPAAPMAAKGPGND